jgi:hypothetical protein
MSDKHALYLICMRRKFDGPDFFAIEARVRERQIGSPAMWPHVGNFAR